MDEMEVDPSLYGTRADGTDSLLWRILQTPECRTVPVIARFLQAAMIGIRSSPEELLWRAQNLVNRIAKYGEHAVPKNELDLVSWSDLTLDTHGVAFDPAQREAEEALNRQQKRWDTQAARLAIKTGRFRQGGSGAPGQIAVNRFVLPPARVFFVVPSAAAVARSIPRWSSLVRVNVMWHPRPA